MEGGRFSPDALELVIGDRPSEWSARRGENIRNGYARPVPLQNGRNAGAESRVVNYPNFDTSFLGSPGDFDYRYQ